MRWFEDRTKGAPPQAAPTGQGQAEPGSAARKAEPGAPPVGTGAFAAGTGAFTAGTGNSAPGAGHGPLTPAEMEEFAEFRRVKKAEELRRRLQMIDHTLLKQTATREDIRKLCAEAREIGFYSVCVQPVYVAACNTFLKDAPQVKIACVVGFPMGENSIYTRPVRDLELSVRSENCLLRGGVHMIGELVSRTRDDLLKIRNLGKISLKEIEEKLAKFDLHLSGDISTPIDDDDEDLENNEQNPKEE